MTKWTRFPSLGNRAVTIASTLLCAGMITTGVQASPIYNGGPTMTGANDVYYIWYGNWAGNTALTILPNLITNLSGSSYMNIITTYGDSNQVDFGGSYTIANASNSLWQGSSLNGISTTQIQSIVSNVLAAGDLPTDPHGVYDVLTATNILVSGFETTFCGWHYSTDWGTKTLGVQYGFIGDPIQGDGCNLPVQDAPSANGNFGADAMASVISHELFETVTDPTGGGWRDFIPGSSTFGNEVGDMCNFNFGPTFVTGSGANANVTLNGTNYLLQRQWLNTGGGSGFTGGRCATALALPMPEPSTLAILIGGLLCMRRIQRRRRR